MLSFRFIVAYNEKKTIKISGAIVGRINVTVHFVLSNESTCQYI